MYKTKYVELHTQKSIYVCICIYVHKCMFVLQYLTFQYFIRNPFCVINIHRQHNCLRFCPTYLNVSSHVPKIVFINLYGCGGTTLFFM